MKTIIRIAILDLYNGKKNEGIRSLLSLVRKEAAPLSIGVEYEVFDARSKNKLPDASWDIYLSSGGPGSPLSSKGSKWETSYFNLIEKLATHNQNKNERKKYVFFICHSMQLICRHWKVGELRRREFPSYGIFPVRLTREGNMDPLFCRLTHPFFALDSRKYEVVHPDRALMEREGFTLTATESVSPKHESSASVMAIRFSDEFIGTQFHPEADAKGIERYFASSKKKETIISNYGKNTFGSMKRMTKETAATTRENILPVYLRNAFSNLSTKN